MSKLTITLSDPRAPEAARLLDQSHALMATLYADEDNHALDIDELATPGIQFFVAKQDDKALGCVAMALKVGYGEVKSLFVDSAARGLGVADALMQALDEAAKTVGLNKLKLETGDELAAAVRLYTRHGYVKCGPFGDYVESPASVFMEKSLAGA